MPTDNRLLSIVVPLYNEGDVVDGFADELSRRLNALPVEWEILWVNDGSSDDTFDKVRALCLKDKRHKGLSFSRNFGKEAAMYAGLGHARGDAVIVMDGDGQHPVALVPEMVDLWLKDAADVISARKNNRNVDSLGAKITASVFNKFLKMLSGLDMEGASDYRLMKRQVVDAILMVPERIRFFRGLSSWVGFRHVSIPFDVAPRMRGASKWGFRSLTKLSVDAITGFSTKPLIWVFASGLLGVSVSLFLFIQAIWSWAFDIAVSGWTSLTVLILFFGSANLLAVGTVGLYLARVFEEVKQRPHYIVAEEIRHEDEV